MVCMNWTKNWTKWQAFLRVILISVADDEIEGKPQRGMCEISILHVVCRGVDTTEWPSDVPKVHQTNVLAASS